MKKLYVLAATVLTAVNLQAQNWVTVDFEDQNLSSETYYNGADEAGGFTSGNVFFNNLYDTAWGGYHASGFAYSNITDNTTSGFMNSYSAFPGMGADSSEIYAIHWSSDTLVFSNLVSLDKVSISNSTYTGISMRDGDSFGKEFGSSLDANGDVDGTNGEDFCFVRLRAWDIAGSYIDSVDVYLADYRFNADSLDYILDTWLTVDLSSFQGVKSITCEMYSSDNGQFGMNTPAYFAMDNLVYSNSIASIDKNENYLNVYPNPFENTISVNGFFGEYNVVALNGTTVAKGIVFGEETINLQDLNSGVYILKVFNNTRVRTQKIVKK